MRYLQVLAAAFTLPVWLGAMAHLAISGFNGETFAFVCVGIGLSALGLDWLLQRRKRKPGPSLSPGESYTITNVKREGDDAVLILSVGGETCRLRVVGLYAGEAA